MDGGSCWADGWVQEVLRQAGEWISHCSVVKRNGCSGRGTGDDGKDEEEEEACFHLVFLSYLSVCLSDE